MTIIDLHQHSTLSDGTDTLEELIQKNVEKGLEIMAVTDHDTIKSAKLLLTNPHKKYGIKYVTGIEFSTEFENESIHLLGYGYSPCDEIMESLVEKSRQLRLNRIKKRIEILSSQFGIELTSAELEQINSSDNPNKPMLANILLKRGLGENITEIIKKYLYHKMPDDKLKTDEVIKTLAQHNIKTVYAHSLGGVGEKRVDREVFEHRLKVFVECGLSGLECYYSLYNQEEQEYLLSQAKRYNLLISGGSDYHGKNKTVQIGELSNYGFKPEKSQVTLLQSVTINEI